MRMFVKHANSRWQLQQAAAQTPESPGIQKGWEIQSGLLTSHKEELSLQSGDDSPQVTVKLGQKPGANLDLLSWLNDPPFTKTRPVDQLYFQSSIGRTEGTF